MLRKTIKLSEETKSLLDARKTEETSYDKKILSLLTDSAPTIYSITSPQTPSIPNPGANAGDDAFGVYAKTLKWIADTKKKLPQNTDDEYTVTSEMRTEAFHLDPLLKGIIAPFKKNILLGNYEIVTSDNKKFEEMVTAMDEFLEEIKFLQTCRDDYENYDIIHGKSYWRKDYTGERLTRLQILESKAMNTYIDPWDSNIRAYHQKILVNTTWGSTEYSTNATEANSWFIPSGGKIIESEGIEEPGAREQWEKYKTKYNISETIGLRVGAAEDIITMQKCKPGDPAPIDSAILAIWLKRTVLANAVNLIYSVQNPFMHMKKGVMLETTDPTTGQKQLITSVPQTPPASMSTTDPERYAALTAACTAFTESLKTDLANLVRYRAEGGLFASGPDTSLDIRESASNISHAFIQVIINQLNEDISQAFGFPMALIQARGSELATSQTIKEFFNSTQAGSKREYEKIATDLLKERFGGVVFNYSITNKQGGTETGTYTMDETEFEYKLGIQDNKDILRDAQTDLINMQALQLVKALGGSKGDIQALADEKGFGILDLDNFDAPAGTPQSQFGQEGFGRMGGNTSMPGENAPGTEKPQLAGKVSKLMPDLGAEFKLQKETDPLERPPRATEPITQSTVTPPHGKLTSDEYAEIKRVFGEIGCSIGKDKDGYFAYTHRARSKSYPSIAKIPKSALAFIETTSTVTDTSNDDEKLAKDLLASYKEAEAAIVKVLEA